MKKTRMKERSSCSLQTQEGGSESHASRESGSCRQLGVVRAQRQGKRRCSGCSSSSIAAAFGSIIDCPRFYSRPPPANGPIAPGRRLPREQRAEQGEASGQRRVRGSAQVLRRLGRPSWAREVAGDGRGGKIAREREEG